ncbi:peptidase inhibitor family I36 protein [Streptomyces zhihengii]|uniref:peptidase inhibitor family I36 protein n=1 Tax=Streptomyces zhihengii TaxID=1818004 RepID=UPI003697155C
MRRHTRLRRHTRRPSARTAAAAVLVAAALIPPALGPVGAATAASAVPPPSAAPRLGSCGAGELCLWTTGGFQGARRVHELSGLDIESCTALPGGATAASLANRTGRPVTTYQSAECAETGEFETYPGTGTWVPESPYRIRAFKVWER